MTLRAIIAGAGIGGLATALALTRGGCEVSIYERAPALEEFGAGLQVTPNATRILARLGLLDDVRQFATVPRAMRVIRGRDNFELAHMSLEGCERRWGAPYFVMHRADLQRVLLDAVKRRANTNLTLGAEVVEATSSDDGVTVGFKPGRGLASETADVLVGADGLRSVIRDRLGLGLADGLTFTGRVAFRAAVDVTRVDSRWGRPDVMLRLGPNAHLVHYPLRGGALVNLVAVVDMGWIRLS